MAPFIFALVTLLSSQMVVGDFSYDGSHGPSHWGKDYKTCVGKYQSPIDIKDKDVTITTFPLLQFSNVDSPQAAYMINNGHTVMIQSADSTVPVPEISGGPINDTYVFQQLHFHWGQNDNVGSEDLINNHSFSMELHAVFYKKSHESYAEAMKHPDGLTVLGYLYQATDEPNPAFASIVSQIPEIADVGGNVTINDTNVLNKLIAPDIVTAQNYYTYKGSLTTPPCFEIVLWIDFTQPQSISHEQLAAFRNIQSTDGKNLTHNFRPVQPLDGRIIYRNNIDESETPTVTNTPKTTGKAPDSTTPLTTPSTKSTPEPKKTEPENKNATQNSGQEAMWSTAQFAMVLGTFFVLQFH